MKRGPHYDLMAPTTYKCQFKEAVCVYIYIQSIFFISQLSSPSLTIVITLDVKLSLTTTNERKMVMMTMMQLYHQWSDFGILNLMFSGFYLVILGFYHRSFGVSFFPRYFKIFII